MNKTTKTIIYTAITAVLFISFFYFYETEIFEAEIIENNASYTHDICLRALFDYTYLPEVVSQNMLNTVSLTPKGFFLLFICLIGLPTMIGYRIATNNPFEKKEEQD